MSERIDIVIEVDNSELKRAESEVDTFEKESDQVITEVKRRTRESFNQVMSMARGAYLVGLGMVKASGESVSYFFRAMMSAAFSTISILGPQLQAALAKGEATYDPWAIAQSIMGLASLGVSIAATIAAQQKQTDLARGLRGADMALLGVQQLIGTFSNFY